MNVKRLKELIAEENLVINDKSTNKNFKQKAIFQKSIWEKLLRVVE